jgi:hypothetical protein
MHVGDQTVFAVGRHSRISPYANVDEHHLSEKHGLSVITLSAGPFPETTSIINKAEIFKVRSLIEDVKYTSTEPEQLEIRSVKNREVNAENKISIHSVNSAVDPN